jgi:phosphatidylglycerophosphate synthase
MTDLDAIVLATDALSRVRIAGLTARERAVRVAQKAGAVRVLVVEESSMLAELHAWRGSSHRPLLVVRADQLVHTGLVLPLIEVLPRDGVAMAVVPSDPAVQDLTVGSYAGAFVATGNAVSEIIASLVGRDGDDRAVVSAFASPSRVDHGEVARAPLRTRDEIKTAHRVLYRILIKPQDNAITRYLYRPVSFPLTRLLVWTRVTPNQISYFVAALVALGCWFTASASFGNAIIGSVIVLAASYLDCCDGEVARVKLLSSRFGAWIDTVVDELSSVGYMIAIGWHCHLHFGRAAFPPVPFEPWKAAIAISTVAMMWCIYCIYYNIIVAVGSANSQDYVGRFQVVPGRQPNTVRLAPVAPKAIMPKQPLPEPLQTLAEIAPYIVRRDFICWLAVVLSVSHLTYVAFGMFFVGAIVSFVVLTIDHIKLRSLRRAVVRDGMSLEAP